MPEITVKSDKYETPAYLSSPEGQNLPAIIVIHEVWGLNAHTRDVADRLKNEGFVALAPDLLSHTGILDQISPQIMNEIRNPETRDEAQKKMRAAMAPISSPEFAVETVEKLKNCFEYLENLPNVDKSKISVVGFCLGGTYSFQLAANEPKLYKAAPFYGHAPMDENILSKINCPILAFYGEKDERLMEQLPGLDEMMKKLGKNFQYIVYPDTGHAFFNDTNPNMYNPKSAADAWPKLLDFLKK